MKGFSATEPLQLVPHGGGYQYRYNIEQIERETDEGSVTEYRYDYVNTLDTDIATIVRNLRNRLIAETDYLLKPDYPISNDERVKVMEYRQALRDVPQQVGFPDAIVWPEVK